MLPNTKLPTSGRAKFIFGIGLGSLLTIPVLVFISLFIADFGMMQPLLGLVLPAALIALILGINFRKKAEENPQSKRLATAGLIISIVSLSLIFILILIVMLFFLPDFFMH